MSHCHTLIDTLRGRGFRITPQREMILEALAHGEGHQTAEALYEKVRERTRAINIATVYRTLDLLVDEGLACRADLQDGQAVYTTTLHGPHIHLVCRSCGRAIKAEYEHLAPLEAAILSEHGFQADLQHLSLGGLCAACREKFQAPSA